MSSAPLDEALDLALAPDYEQFWFRCLHPFVMPLALAVSRRNDVPLPDLLRHGPRPPRGAIVYERCGGGLDFDAIEVRDDQLRVHHYLTCRFKAPLLFEPGLDAFEYLRDLDGQWARALSRLTEPGRSRVEALRGADRCVHVVSYDPAEAAPIDGHTERAAAHYRVRLETADFRTL